MQIKYNTAFLTKLEDLLSKNNYIIRYEKGRFKSGYCILRNEKTIVINKFCSLEGKINALIEILRIIKPELKNLDDKMKVLYNELFESKQQLTLFEKIK